MKLLFWKNLSMYSILFSLNFFSITMNASELTALNSLNAANRESILPETITVTFDQENEEDNQSIEIEKKVYKCMKTLFFGEQLSNPKDKAPLVLKNRLVPQDGVKLSMELTHNVLNDLGIDAINGYCVNPDVDSVDLINNEHLVEKHFNAIFSSYVEPKNKIQALINMYKAADYLNLQLLKTAQENNQPHVVDYSLLNLIKKNTINSLAFCENIFDVSIEHSPLEEQLKFELIQKYNHPEAKVIFKKFNVIGHRYVGNATTKGFFWNVKLSADGSVLLISSLDGIIVTDVRNEKCIFSFYDGDVHGHGREGFSALLSPDGSRLMVNLSGQKIMIYNVKTKECIAHIDTGYDRDRLWYFEVNRRQLSSDGDLLVTGSRGKVMVYNVRTGEHIFSVDRSNDPQGEKIQGFSLSGNNSTLAICSLDKVMVYNVRTGEHLLSVNTDAFDGHTQNIQDALLNHNGTALVARSYNKVTVHNVQTGVCTLSVDTGVRDFSPALSLDLSPDGSFVVIHSYRNNDIRIYNVENGNEVFSLPRDAFSDHKDTISVKFKNGMLVTKSNDKVKEHLLPLKIVVPQKQMNKLCADCDEKKVVSVFQSNFTEEIIEKLSLAQINAVVYAQQYNQEYPKIVIIPDVQNMKVDVQFVEEPLENVKPVASTSTDETFYKCVYPSCNQAFATRADLEKHVQIHILFLMGKNHLDDDGDNDKNYKAKRKKSDQ